MTATLATALPVPTERAPDKLKFTLSESAEFLFCMAGDIWYTIFQRENHTFHADYSFDTPYDAVTLGLFDKIKDAQVACQNHFNTQAK